MFFIKLDRDVHFSLAPHSQLWFLARMVTETIQRLRAALKLRGFTKRKLAELAGLHPNTLLGCEDDNWNPKASTLIAIEPHLPAIGADDTNA